MIFLLPWFLFLIKINGSKWRPLFISCISRASVSIMSYVKWHYVSGHIAMKEKSGELGECRNYVSLYQGTPQKHCLYCVFPLYLGNKARWSLWLHLSGVSRAGAEPVHLLRVPVCQRIPGKWGCCRPLLLRVEEVEETVFAVSSAANSVLCAERRRHLEMFLPLKDEQKSRATDRPLWHF